MTVIQIVGEIKEAVDHIRLMYEAHAIQKFSRAEGAGI